MLRSMKDLEGMTLHAVDGDIGQVNEFYFDDQNWTVRYLVADGRDAFGRRVLISPASFVGVDRINHEIEVNLTREQVKNSPPVDLHRPVSREYEGRYAGYYGYGPYWLGPGNFRVGGATPSALSGEQGAAAAAAENARRQSAAAVDSRGESHLHSSAEVFGYHIHATDGEIGHVDDFIVEDGTWAIRYMRVDTSNFIGGKAVLVARSALDRVDWDDATIHVNVTRDAVKGSPEYDASNIGRDYEARFYRYYGQHPYWEP